MKPLSSALWSALFLAGASAVASAQTPPAKDTPAPAVPAQQPSGIVILKSSALMQAEVSNAQGEKLCRLSDFVIHPQTGSVEYVALACSDISGLGADKLLFVPWRHVKADTRGQKWTLSVDKAKLEKAPTFEKSKWPDFTKEDWDASWRSYYGADSSRPAEAGAPRMGVGELHALRASELINHTCQTADGKEAIQVRDVGIDTVNGRVNLLLVNASRLLGEGSDKTFAVPFELFRFSRDSKTSGGAAAGGAAGGAGAAGGSAGVSTARAMPMCSFNVTADKLRGAPEFLETKLVDTVWVGDLYKYYGVRTYWPMSKQ